MTAYDLRNDDHYRFILVMYLTADVGVTEKGWCGSFVEGASVYPGSTALRTADKPLLLKYRVCLTHGYSADTQIAYKLCLGG